jgi:hypothetical protein
VSVGVEIIRLPEDHREHIWPQIAFGHVTLTHFRVTNVGTMK